MSILIYKKKKEGKSIIRQRRGGRNDTRTLCTAFSFVEDLKRGGEGDIHQRRGLRNPGKGNSETSRPRTLGLKGDANRGGDLVHRGRGPQSWGSEPKGHVSRADIRRDSDQAIRFRKH